MEATAQKKVDWRARAKQAFRKRWVWVCIVGLVWLLVLILSYAKFGPKSVTKGGEKGDTSKFKFIHCDKCNTELPYNSSLDGKTCSRCPPPNTGFYVATESSVRSGVGAMSPWTKVYVAWFVGSVFMLGVVTFLMYRPVVDPKAVYYVIACPYCAQRLRYRSVSHGGLGSCSRCKRMLRFPNEEDAVTEDELARRDRGG